jgi:hypothetical protein
MRSLLYLPALLVAVKSSPLQARQLLDIGVLEDTPTPSSVSIPLELTSQAVTYDVAGATATATRIPLPVQTAAASNTLKARNACDPQASGAGPVPSPDTASAFLAYPSLRSIASAAPVPTGYTQTFSNLNGSSSAYGYMGFTTLTSYDTDQCAAKCDKITGCVGINIYFERDPSVEPGTGCTNPPSTTAIKCVFWGGYLSAAGASNTGQWRADFQVVIAGSNAYMSNTIKPISGFAGFALGNAAINAPLDCNGADTYMGVKTFSNSYYDAGLCAAACVSQNEYNTAHPPNNSPPSLCKFFTSYMISKNGQPQGQYCAMYTEPWDITYATNEVRKKSHEQYFVKVSMLN